MSYQDPTGDTMTTEGASVPPLVGYGADSTLNTNSGGDAIPTSTTPLGATPGMGAPQPSSSPQHLGSTLSEEGEPEGATIEVTEVEVEALDDESWNLRRAGLIAGVVAAGLATGAGAAWFLINRRRAQQARIAAAQVAQIAQARRIFGMLPAQSKANLTPALSRFIAVAAPARQRLANASDTSVELTKRASQSTRELSATAVTLAESALAAAQDALDRALAISQTLREQTVSASQVAQDRFGDTWDRTRDTALITWEAAAQTAKVARDAALHTVSVMSDAAKKTADTATVESKRTAKVAQAGYKRAKKAATR